MKKYRLGNFVRYAVFTELIFSFWIVGRAFGWLLCIFCIVLILSVPRLFKKITISTSRAEQGSQIMYKPNAPYNIIVFMWSTIMLIILFSYVTFYLKTNFSILNFAFDIPSYAIFMIWVNTLGSIYFLIETIINKNNHIILTEGNITYKHRKNSIILPTASMYSIKEVSGDISILFNDMPRHLIPTEKMGFFMGLLDDDLPKEIAKEIDKHIPEKNRLPELENVNKKEKDEIKSGNATNIPKKGSKIGTIIVGIIMVLAVVVVSGLIYGYMKLESWYNNSISKIYGTSSSATTVWDEFGSFQNFTAETCLFVLAGIFIIVIIGYTIKELFKKKSNNPSEDSKAPNK